MKSCTEVRWTQQTNYSWKVLPNIKSPWIGTDSDNVGVVDVLNRYNRRQWKT